MVSPSGRDFQSYARGLTLEPAPKGAHTLVYKNYTNAGRRRQLCEHADRAQPPILTPTIRRYVKQADIIVVAPLLPNYSAAYLQALLPAKRPDCLTALLPQGYLRLVNGQGRVKPQSFEAAASILPMFDLAVLSAEDHPDSLKLARQWAKLTDAPRIIVTQAAKGASWVKPETTTLVVTEPVPENLVMDSVGCGDTFSAAAILDYFHNRDVVKAIQAGNQAARLRLLQAVQTNRQSF